MKIICTRMGFHTNHTHHVMIMNKTQHAVLQNRGLNVKTDERKILYSSFRPLYLCTFASDKSCLTEIHRKLQNLRLLPSHYLSLWEKLISRLFLIYSYSNIVFFYKTRPFSVQKAMYHNAACGITQCQQSFSKMKSSSSHTVLYGLIRSRHSRTCASAGVTARLSSSR